MTAILFLFYVFAVQAINQITVPMPLPSQVTIPMPLPSQVTIPMPLPSQVTIPMPLPSQVTIPMPLPSQVTIPMPLPSQVTIPMPLPSQDNTLPLPQRMILCISLTDTGYHKYLSCTPIIGRLYKTLLKFFKGLT